MVEVLGMLKNNQNVWYRWWQNKVDKSAGMTVYNPYEDPPNQRALAFQQNWQIIDRLIHDWIKTTSYETNKEHKSLEIGCGRGTISKYLKDYWGFETYTMDFLPKMGKYNHNFICADVIDTWPFKRGSFDLILSYGLLEHFKELHQWYIYLKSLSHLKENGLVIHYVALVGDDIVPRYEFNVIRANRIYVYPKWANQFTFKIANRFMKSPWVTNKRWAKGVFVITELRKRNNENTCVNYSKGMNE